MLNQWQKSIVDRLRHAMHHHQPVTLGADEVHIAMNAIEELDALKADIEAGRLVRLHPAEEVPPTEDAATYLVIVEHFKTKTRRAEFTEFRFGEWDVSNTWNLIAWAEYPIFARAAMDEDGA